MAENYILLERIELNADASSVTFSNIPQSGYTDLKIVASSRTSRTSDTDAIKIRFNGSSSSYTNKVLYGSGSGTASFAGSTDAIGNAYTASNYLATGLFGSQEFYIPNYTGSSYKSVSVDSVEEANTTYAEMDMIAGLWSNTAAITSIEILPNVGGSLIKYSTFSLYGLAAVGTTPAIAPKASGGNITTDGTYWYHTFLTSGTFTPQVGLTCDYLVVAGGGGGGRDVSTGIGGGGGGAGGLRSTLTATGGGGSLESPITVTSGTSYTITIGAGGTTGTTRGTTGTAGGNSTFSTVTATGGGGGASYGINGGNGGSGGGAYAGSSAGTGTTNQGYAGAVTIINNSNGSGGGGAGSAGTAASSTGPIKGNGGSGVTITTLATPTGTGVSGAYAGGGGGGRYGTETAGPGTASAGGGAGGDSSAGTNGTSNTGGGGGGGASTSGSAYDGGSGGSGIVIIRYAMA